MADTRPFQIDEERRAHERNMRFLRRRLDWQRRNTYAALSSLPSEEWLQVFRDLGKDLIALLKLDIERLKLAAGKLPDDSDGRSLEETLVAYLRILTPDQRHALIASLADA